MRDNIHMDYSVNQKKLQKLQELELIVKVYMVYGDTTLMGEKSVLQKTKMIASIHCTDLVAKKMS